MAEKLNLFIGGSLVQSGTKSWIEVLNPATQEVLCEAPCATDEEIEMAIKIHVQRVRPEVKLGELGIGIEGGHE